MRGDTKLAVVMMTVVAVDMVGGCGDGCTGGVGIAKERVAALLIPMLREENTKSKQPPE